MAPIGVHIRQPDQVVKRDSYSPDRLSAFARPRSHSTRETAPIFIPGVAQPAIEVVKRKDTSPNARYGGESNKWKTRFTARLVPRGGGPCFSQDRTSICCLEPVVGRRR